MRGRVSGEGFVEELERDAFAALAVIREPDLGAAAAAEPAHQYKPGAEFEPGSQFHHRGSTRAARLRRPASFASAAGATGAVGTSPVSSW